MFSIKLNSSSERSEDLTGFLFRVEDLMSKNVSYIWKVSSLMVRLFLGICYYLLAKICILEDLTNGNGNTSFARPVWVIVACAYHFIPCK